MCCLILVLDEGGLFLHRRFVIYLVARQIGLRGLISLGQLGRR